MPAIAAGVLRDRAAFYWHLGDFRAIYTFDEDILHQPEHIATPLAISDYEAAAWPDFIDSQLAPFGSLPVFLALGNHETTPPKTRADLMPQFADWFNSPAIARQRLLDDPQDHLAKFYYRWIDRGVAFYTLDNATVDQFDSVQLRWFERVLARDAADPRIATVVLGMHEALPESIGASHSMNDWAAGTESGRRVYADLLRFQNDSHKRVYVLASHSHFFMDGIFNTDYWRVSRRRPARLDRRHGGRRALRAPAQRPRRSRRRDQRLRLPARHRPALRRDSLQLQEARGIRCARPRRRPLRRGLRSLVLGREHPSEVGIASLLPVSLCDASMYHMKKASVRDLRYGFKKIERLLHEGEEIQITKRKHVIARLVPEGHACHESAGLPRPAAFHLR